MTNQFTKFAAIADEELLATYGGIAIGPALVGVGVATAAFVKPLAIAAASYGVHKAVGIGVDRVVDAVRG